jgi:hypothetical protein
MRNKSRRFEVLLPARFNDGREVSDDLIGEAIDEVIDQFHAASFYKDAAEGYWRHEAWFFMTALVNWSWICRTPPSTENG